MKQHVPRLLLLLLVLLSLTACLTDLLNHLYEPAETELPFASIMQTTECPTQFVRELRLLFVTTAEELTLLQGLVDAKTASQLQAIDLTSTAIVALFRGAQPSHAHDVVIKRIMRRESELVVEAEFGEPGYGGVAGHEGIAACHLVQVAYPAVERTVPLFHVFLRSEMVYR